MDVRITNEENYKVKSLLQFGFGKDDFFLNENAVDIKVKNIWLEVKQNTTDPYQMLAQLALTVNNVKTNRLPKFFGAFDNKNGYIIENYQMKKIFSCHDIDWRQTPSSVNKQTIERVRYKIEEDGLKEYSSLEEFWKAVKEISTNNTFGKIEISINNIESVYDEWEKAIGSQIKDNIDKHTPIANYFYADILYGSKSNKNKGIYVECVVKNDIDELYSFEHENALLGKIEIRKQKEYKNFWSKYQRPPKEEFQDDLIKEKYNLYSKSDRVKTGAFYTPLIWSAKSKEYFKEVLGENWQDEYYIWNPACGTGRLLEGLKDTDRVFASTLDEADIKYLDTLKINQNGTHFQFDFLNDEFKSREDGGKLPNKLYEIIKNEPEKLIIYMNPPYKNTGDKTHKAGTKNNDGENLHSKLKNDMRGCGLGTASSEMFVQFYYRIYNEIKNCIIGSFSKITALTGPNFKKWRSHFKAEFKGGFVVPADTFDNVKGMFPISFQIWDSSKKLEMPKEFLFDIYDKDNVFLGRKTAMSYDGIHLINDWIEPFIKERGDNKWGYFRNTGCDFSNQNFISLYDKSKKEEFEKNSASKKLRGDCKNITPNNIKEALIYVAVRRVIMLDWLNDRDLFFSPKEIENTEIMTNKKIKYSYEDDEEFVNNCIVYSLFGGHNNMGYAAIVDKEGNYVKKPNKKELERECVETPWTFFTNSEIDSVHTAGVERDLTLHNILLKDKVFSKEAQELLEYLKRVYKTFFDEGNRKYFNVGFKEVHMTLKEEKNCDYSEKDLKALRDALASKIEEGIYKHGFLKE